MAAVGTTIATEFGDPSSANWYIAAWITAITVGFTIWLVSCLCSEKYSMVMAF
jgi:hypothetical protein